MEEEEDEAPVVVETDESIKVGFDLKQNLTKPGAAKAFGNNKNVFKVYFIFHKISQLFSKPSGKWTSVDQGLKPHQPSGYFPN